MSAETFDSRLDALDAWLKTQRDEVSHPSGRGALHFRKKNEAIKQVGRRHGEFLALIARLGSEKDGGAAVEHALGRYVLSALVASPKTGLRRVLSVLVAENRHDKSAPGGPIEGFVKAIDDTLAARWQEARSAPERTSYAITFIRGGSNRGKDGEMLDVDAKFGEESAELVQAISAPPSWTRRLRVYLRTWRDVKYEAVAEELANVTFAGITLALRHGDYENSGQLPTLLGCVEAAIAQCTDYRAQPEVAPVPTS